MSTLRQKLRHTAVTVDLGCGSGFCRRPKLFSIFTPKLKPKTPKPKHKKQQHSSTSTMSWNKQESPSKTSKTSSTATWTCSRAVQGFGRVGGESVAVEKETEDPYLDFRRSMLQMIMEKEIYSKEELKELLNCFLQLNDPYYHGIIARAFTEIWHGVFFGI